MAFCHCNQSDFWFKFYSYKYHKRMKFHCTCFLRFSLLALLPFRPHVNSQMTIEFITKKCQVRLKGALKFKFIA